MDICWLNVVSLFQGKVFVVGVDYDYLLSSFKQMLPFFECIDDHLKLFFMNFMIYFNH
jgi:hypothetical protein